MVRFEVNIPKEAYCAESDENERTAEKAGDFRYYCYPGTRCMASPTGATGSTGSGAAARAWNGTHCNKNVQISSMDRERLIQWLLRSLFVPP